MSVVVVYACSYLTIWSFEDQYEFVYRGLLEAFQVGDTLLTAMDLQLKYPDLKQTNATTGESRLQAQFSVWYTSLVK